MLFALSAGAGRGRPTRTSGHRAGRGGRAIEAAMCHRSASVPARTRQPSVPAKRTENKKIVTLEPFEPTPVKCGPREVQTWPPFVAISTVWSDPRRSRRLSCTLVRYNTSAIAHDDVNAISGELAQSDAHLGLERAPRARRSVSVDMNGPRDTLQQLTSRSNVTLV